MKISSPQPSVLHLVTLFRQITSGEIRIPAFQREFVWKEKQIIALLESVTEGFPIGSLLLWAVDSQILKIAPSEATSFPNVAEHYPTSYVLDGMQRLSSLYGVFHYGITTNNPKFDVVYNLSTGCFSHRSDLIGSSTFDIPLSSIFRPRALLEQQNKIATLSGSDELIDKLLQLQGAFQDYMVPVVSIRSTDIHRIVGIFERINSTGTRLDPVDFMRAITWAENFDLNKYLDESVRQLSEIGLDLSPETVIKCVGIVLNIEPTTDGLLKLRDQTPQKLADAFYSAVSILKRVSNFLAERFHIHSSYLVPYEGQLLLLFKSIGLEELTPQEVDSILRWYWATGLNESLRGKPDHYVTRALDNWRGLIKGEIRGLEPRIKISSLDLLERRLVSGKALSAAFAMVFAHNQARSLVTGEVIDPKVYMNNAYSDYFNPVFSLNEINSFSLKNSVSARVFPNLILCEKPSLRGSEASIRDLITNVFEQDRLDILESQFISMNAIKKLVVGDISGFFEERANVIFNYAKSLIGA